MTYPPLNFIAPTYGCLIFFLSIAKRLENHRGPSPSLTELMAPFASLAKEVLQLLFGATGVCLFPVLPLYCLAHYQALLAIISSPKCTGKKFLKPQEVNRLSIFILKKRCVRYMYCEELRLQPLQIEEGWGLSYSHLFTSFSHYSKMVTKILMVFLVNVINDMTVLNILLGLT